MTPEDRAELRLFESFLRRRADRPEELTSSAYAEVYGDLVFEDTHHPECAWMPGQDELCSCTERGRT